jgi:hypothetical protein
MKRKKTKKNIKARDLKPRKDAKGGGIQFAKANQGFNFAKANQSTAKN